MKDLLSTYPSNKNFSVRQIKVYINPTDYEIEYFINLIIESVQILKTHQTIKWFYIKTSEKNALLVVSSLYQKRFKEIKKNNPNLKKIEIHNKLLLEKNESGLTFRQHVFETKLKDTVFQRYKSADCFFQFSYMDPEIIKIIVEILENKSLKIKISSLNYLLNENLKKKDIVENLNLIKCLTETVNENKKKIEKKLQKIKFSKFIFDLMLEKQGGDSKFYTSKKFNMNFYSYEDFENKINFFDEGFMVDYSFLMNTNEKSDNYKKRKEDLDEILAKIHKFLQNKNKYETILDTHDLKKGVNIDESSIQICAEDFNIIIYNEEFVPFFQKHQTTLFIMDIPGGGLYSKNLDKLEYNQKLNLEPLIKSIESFIDNNSLKYLNFNILEIFYCYFWPYWSISCY